VNETLEGEVSPEAGGEEAPAENPIHLDEIENEASTYEPPAGATLDEKIIARRDENAND